MHRYRIAANRSGLMVAISRNYPVAGPLATPGVGRRHPQMAGAAVPVGGTALGG